MQRTNVQEMKKEVGLFGAISVLAGIMIGSGIFYIGSYVLIRCQMHMGLALLVWVLGGFVTLMSGICFAELGAMIPKAGGTYVYLREAYGKRLAFISGFSNFILGASGSNAALALALASAVSMFLPMAEFTQKIFAVAMIILLTGINILGIKLGSKIQNIFMVLKMLPILLIMIGGLCFGQQQVDLSIPSSSEVNIASLMGMIAFAMIATMWAYEGWTNLNGIAEELKHPQRNLPLAIIISICGVTLLYVGFNYAIYRVLPLDTIYQLLDSGNYYLGSAVADTLFGSWGKTIVGLAMMLAIFNALNGCIMVFPRNYYAMAKDGAFIQRLGVLHPVYKTPVYALIASAIVSSILIFSRDLSQLTSLVAIVGIIFNALIFYAVVVLRKKYPTMHRPYKVWAYPITIILVICVMIGLIINTFMEDPTTSIIGCVVPCIGWLVYQCLYAKGNKEQSMEDRA